MKAMLLHDRRGVVAEGGEKAPEDGDAPEDLFYEDNEKGSGRKAASQKELSKELFPSATKGQRSDTTSTLSSPDP